MAAVRQVNVVCLAGSGGPRLGDELRRAAAEAPVAVRLLVTTGDSERPPVMVGDPLSGAFWPYPASRASDAADSCASRDAAAYRRARQLRWFCWEMGFDARCEVTAGSATEVFRTATAGGVDLVIVATSCARRWRGATRELLRQGARAGVAVRCANDRQVGRLSAWCA